MLSVRPGSGAVSGATAIGREAITGSWGVKCLFEHAERWERHAASTHAQNDSPRVTRTERGSTGCKWMSSTPAAGSPVRRDV